MRWGSVLWFSDNPRPFLVKEHYCNDAECTCNGVGLTLQEISDCGNEVSEPISLRLQVDLATWKERDPPERSLQAAGWVRQLLSQFPADRRAELKARFQEMKQRAARIAQYTINPDDVTEGILFSYTDLLDDQGSLSSGGLGYTFGLVYQNAEYLVEDIYCPKPTCDCREIHLRFWKVEIQSQAGTRGAITELFLGKVTFNGKRTVVGDVDCLPAVAEAILGAWWDCRRDDLLMLKERYEEVKKIGQRSLNVTAVSSVMRPLKSGQSPTLSVASSVEEFLKDDPHFSQKRVGRNDPCPCGSGLKYKRCCGKPK